MSKNNLSDLMKTPKNKDLLNQEIDLIDKPFSSFLLKNKAIIFDNNRSVQKPIPVISIEESTIATEGNIVTLLGQSKAGKSAVTSGWIAGMINVSSINVDTLGFKIQPNINTQAVLHFDTEQSYYDWHRNQQNVLKRAKIHDKPDFYNSIIIRSLDVNERIQKIEETCEVMSKEFNGINIIIIDGIADLVHSVNDEKECNLLTDKLLKMASDYKTIIVVVIHLNPGQLEKGRGHLGSNLNRKSESMLSVTKEKSSDTSRVKPFLLRNAGVSDTATIEFHWDKEKMRHSFIGYNYSDNYSEPTKKEEAISSISNILESHAPLSHTNLKKQLLKQKFTESTAKRAITAAFDKGKIIKDENNDYVLSNDE